MRYHVRTPEGELAYTSFREVELAYMQGLVGPEDEVREDGQTLWRKASSIPLLVQARPQERLKSERTQLFAIGVAVVLGIFSFLLLMSGSMIGILLALLTSAILMRVMYSAFKPPKRAR